MRSRIAHWTAAFLLISSVLVRYAHPQEVVPTAPGCKTMAAVFGKDIVDGLKARYDLKGSALLSFKEHLEKAVRHQIIDMDELAIYGPEDAFFVLVGLRGSCVIATAIVPDRFVLSLLAGTDT